ncbi:DNA mismatch repair protein [Methanolobus chelungpuianus]|uniref:DNA mismatch repair protein MutL n=1 Tax=Methanolobus chelungpuianus TaxID=502115 RepID=A0AAE3HAK1_9EURY|nr:DNA mismatch repair protein [Methanolobus chelungpuianus]
MQGSRIHVLDESTINKIAAGEVIERPASVVKELIDNSIDANATDIRVEIKGSGTKSILVVDNGSGMSHQDASLAFTKHATSKISSIEDLDRVLTLGFRGEALASIASVCRVELTTRQENDISGTRVVVDSSGIKSISPAGSAVGTSIVVNDLFYSTPARKKYLKSLRTELANITDVVTRHAVAHPGISFTLVSDGKVIIRSPSSGELFDSIVHLYGADVARSLVPVEFRSEFVSISGYISKPELTRSGTDLQAFFINGRSIYSRVIANAVRLGYYTLLPKGRYPAAFLKLEIDPFHVDVNVHPTKREVRLSHEKEIESAITTAVEQALSTADLIPELRITKESTVQSRIHEPEARPPENDGSGTAPADPLFREGRQDYQEKYRQESLPQQPSVVREESQSYRYPMKDTEKRLMRSERLQVKHAPPVKKNEAFPDVKVLGQFADLYILTESEGKLVLVDQHAAHERIMYEQVLKMRDMGWQELITPVTLELSTKEMAIIEDYVPFLEQIGFSISEFGPGAYVVTTVPSIFGRLEEPGIVHDIISDLVSGGRIREDTEVYDRLCSTMACRAAIKAGAVCTPEQMQGLLRQLMLCENPYTCPHGRPTMVSFTKEELGKMFGRT